MWVGGGAGNGWRGGRSEGEEVWKKGGEGELKVGQDRGDRGRGGGEKGEGRKGVREGMKGGLGARWAMVAACQYYHCFAFRW